MTRITPRGNGWRRDLPDFRDYTPQHALASGLAHGAERAFDAKKLAAEVDLRECFPACEDQGTLNASPAFAAVAMVEYFQTRARGQIFKASKLFVYQMTLKMHGLWDDCGAELRTTLKALKRFGAPAESLWPYGSVQFRRQPDDAFLYGFSREFESLCYVRLDRAQGSGKRTLRTVKAVLAAGFPAAFGFPVASSISSGADIPFRPQFDAVVGGQAAVAVGYDDRHRIGSQTGALLVRNSWGQQWGEDGYGWLPYAYIKKKYAVDFWTLLDERSRAANDLQFPVLPQ